MIVRPVLDGVLAPPFAGHRKHDLTSRNPHWLRDAAAVLLAAGAYFALAWVSTHAVPRLGDIAYLWPAGGFALGVLLVCERRLWPAFLAAIVLADLLHALTVTGTLRASLAYATIYFGCLALSAALLRRLLGAPVRLDSLRAVVLFIVVCPLVGNGLAAVLGAVIPHGLPGGALLDKIRVWWFSDALGIGLVTPLVLAWHGFRWKELRGGSPRRVAEAAFVFLAIIVTAQIAFSAEPRASGAVVPLMHLIAPFLIWGALRFGPRGAASAVILLTIVAVWNTFLGRGPFAAAFDGSADAVAYLQGYLAVAAILTLIGSTIMLERERALNASEAWRLRHETAVAFSGHVLYDANLKTGKVVWGGDFESLMGCPPEKLNDANAWFSRVHPDDVGKIDQIVTAAAQAHPGETETVEYRVRREDGTYIYVESSGQVVRLPGGEAVRAIGFLKDVTARKQAQAEREWLDARLREAQKMEALGTMAGGIAHDFNNILGAITGYGEMAADEAAPGSRQRKHINAILEAAQRGKALVDQILGFTRRTPRARKPVELWPVLREARDLLSASTPSGITIQLEVDAETATVLGDATQLHQLVMNLCTNANQAMGQSGTLRMRLTQREVTAPQELSHGGLEPGRYAVLSVSDTGPGIAPEVQARMFEPFYTTKPPGRGTGLGLALVHAIAREQGGAIDVATTLGKGTTFTVYLPLAANPDARPGDSAPAARGHGQTVLVVDDDRLVLSMAEEMLARLGYEPVGYDSSLRALEAFQARPERFDAMLADQRMPELTGTELAVRVRSLSPALPIIIATGYGGTDLDARAKEAGVFAVLGKPYTPEQLAQTMARALPEDRGQRTEESSSRRDLAQSASDAEET